MTVVTRFTPPSPTLPFGRIVQVEVADQLDSDLAKNQPTFTGSNHESHAPEHYLATRRRPTDGRRLCY